MRSIASYGNVSIHAPAWGATVDGIHSSITITVSIHAPAWGATLASIWSYLLALVSIHAPAWGATTLGDFACQVWICFNPRARVGRDY